MALLTISEACIFSGYSIELLEYFSKNCPKHGENIKLNIQIISDEKYIDENELRNYTNYLKKPWPLRKGKYRAYIPDAIKEDVKRESHYQCAICGHMDNGEVAHIEAYKKTLNNSPDNLIFLCPNHHTKYDYGYKPASNITFEVIYATKLTKRESRKRILRYESNAVKELNTIIKYIRKLQKEINSAKSDQIASIQINELKNIINLVPDITSDAIEEAKKDKDSEISKHIIKDAPRISKFAVGINQKSEKEIISASRSLIEASNEIIIDIDEVDCPHCGGRGQTGLVGDICSYCKGSCFVTQAQSDAYDPDEIDEVDCPHCAGRGQTGLAGDICSYCKGSCFVTQAESDAYDPDEIDEVDCPHCAGRGQTGLVDDICNLCKGNQKVSHAIHEAYLQKYGR